ncbi:competence protein ComF / DEAD/DEAH box helicase [Paucilactobacillus hokkaidonensis JCM 18461]|uniref:Competence protein ComF / DEAD/DEAH box helicase n=2 Tax=Paucilactobacillus hokkaidonensis TaxID=1193095 RepID=A0A0A1GW60_9LACO|nr:DNA/RNA helicase [Paucilactobacillus hokkaidonensis]KRO10204.1 helicase domain-containing protein [Paucilactobacillus hokkaidonensis]BAP86220.1 competence protein ComF / DEAD/DEAH box helicase [Paucilactobacillus hokkaidonensis JCM 18461]
MDAEFFYGRRLLDQELTDEFELPKHVQISAAMEVTNTYVRCTRCNYNSSLSEVALPKEQYFCPQCITMGRVSTLSKFYYLPEPNLFKANKHPLSWNGQLSELQQKCSLEVCRCLQKHERHLLWAVTGAGKTEMLFEAISQAIQRGERIALASPRVDVCLELYPRLQQAFATIDICLLHGRETKPYQYRQLTICTTHQLLRFYHAFDNLIIDEVDAFPYAENQQLYFATKQAVKPTGGCLYLTATPGPKLLQQVRQKQLGISYLPLRYHGHLLPEIKIKLTPAWRQQLKQKKLPNSLVLAIKLRIEKQQPFLLFAPHVADLGLIKASLNKRFPGQKCVTVHAADEQRLEKVQLMRDHKVLFLVTTSILERGVTFPEIDVLVLGADDAVFSSAALVQISGRAGRSISRPTGDVIFWIGAYATSIRLAIKQIKFVNKKGHRLVQCNA